MEAALVLITSIVSLVFAIIVLDQYLERRKPYQVVWTIGLCAYATASFVQFLREALGTTEVGFRLWYFTGAMLVAAYLGMGTVYLLAPRRVAHSAMVVLAILTVLGGVLSFSASLGSDVVTALPAGEPLSAKDPLTNASFYPGYVTGVTVFLNIFGTLALAGGALYSAARFAKRRAEARRVTSSVLIFVGALISAAGGTLDRLGLPDPHAAALLAGVAVILAGFLLSREVFATYRWPFRRREGRAPT